MDTNLVVALGSMVAMLAIPAIIRKWAEESSMLVPLASLLIGSAAVALAVTLDPADFSPSDIPKAVIEVIARVL